MRWRASPSAAKGDNPEGYRALSKRLSGPPIGSAVADSHEARLGRPDIGLPAENNRTASLPTELPVRGLSSRGSAAIRP
jgi:hypothetical protein